MINIGEDMKHFSSHFKISLKDSQLKQKELPGIGELQTYIEVKCVIQ